MLLQKAEEVIQKGLTMRKTLKLTGDVSRQAACRYIMQAPEGHTVTIGEQSRSAEANARLHAIAW